MLLGFEKCKIDGTKSKAVKRQVSVTNCRQFALRCVGYFLVFSINPPVAKAICLERQMLNQILNGENARGEGAHAHTGISSG